MTVAANRLTGAAADVADLRLVTQTLAPPNFDGGAAPTVAKLNAGLTPTIEFEFSFDGAALPPATRDEFRSDFHRELRRCEAWAAEQNWPAAPVTDLHVVVSDRFRISRSLVPAWSGHAGRMEFPAWRVATRKAAIAHELIHVLYPNGSRLLAEGLAVFLQAEIGGNPAFPNFGRPLHRIVRELLSDMVPGFRPDDPESLEPIRLTELDAIATPSPLTLRVGDDFYGEEPRGQAHIYPIVGSFVQHLIESRGLGAFRGLYACTPLTVMQQNAGTPDRWSEVYGTPLAKLECEWKARILGE